MTKKQLISLHKVLKCRSVIYFVSHYFFMYLINHIMSMHAHMKAALLPNKHHPVIQLKRINRTYKQVDRRPTVTTTVVVQSPIFVHHFDASNFAMDMFGVGSAACCLGRFPFSHV